MLYNDHCDQKKKKQFPFKKKEHLNTTQPTWFNNIDLNG